jgi:CelD/BcsL family acetyltransferase involved in cellulose biosynthesis
LADHSLFEATFDILHPKGMAQFLLGRIEDTYVAAAVALVYKDTIHGWHRGFDRAYASFLPNDLMVWHVHAPTRLAISKLGYQVYQRFHGIRGSTNGS